MAVVVVYGYGLGLVYGNMKRKIDGSLKQTEYEKNSDWWWIYGGTIWQRWWYMDTDSGRWWISGGGRWQGR